MSDYIYSIKPIIKFAKENRDHILKIVEEDRLFTFRILAELSGLSKEYEDRSDDELEETIAELEEIFLIKSGGQFDSKE